jgi:hypothetical protein
MQTPELPLHLAFRRSLGTDNAGDRDATQRALVNHAEARARRATWLRLTFWGLLLLILFGGIAHVFGAGPAWLDVRLFALFAVAALAQIELRRLRKRRRPWLLPQLSPEGLPESAWAFMKPFREGEQVAYWVDRRGQRRRVPVGMMEPPDTLLLLSDDADLREIGLPWPRDMDEPDIVVAVEASAAAAPPAELAAADERLELAGAEADNSARAAALAEPPEDGDADNMGRRGFIDRASSVYAQPYEAFRPAVAEQFDPDVAGAAQADFHAILAIHAAWEKSPRTANAADLIRRARGHFERNRASDPGVQHVRLPDDRSLRRLIREERREFGAIRKALGMPPRLQAAQQRPTKLRNAATGLPDDARRSI